MEDVQAGTNFFFGAKFHLKPLEFKAIDILHEPFGKMFFDNCRRKSTQNTTLHTPLTNVTVFKASDHFPQASVWGTGRGETHKTVTISAIFFPMYEGLCEQEIIPHQQDTVLPVTYVLVGSLTPTDNCWWPLLT